MLTQDYLKILGVNNPELWLESYNYALCSIPNDLMKTEEGAKIVHDYIIGMLTATGGS